MRNVEDPSIGITIIPIGALPEHRRIPTSEVYSRRFYVARIPVVGDLLSDRAISPHMLRVIEVSIHLNYIGQAAHVIVTPVDKDVDYIKLVEMLNK